MKRIEEFKEGDRVRIRTGTAHTDGKIVAIEPPQLVIEVDGASGTRRVRRRYTLVEKL